MAGLAVVFSLLFVVSMTVAASLYPGGTWFSPQTQGHSFWHNFVCDLLHQQGLNGANNPGAPFALCGLLCQTIALGCLWWSLPGLMRGKSQLGLSIRVLGGLSSVATMLVPLSPSDRFGILHGVFVVLAGVPGFAAAILAVLGLPGRSFARLAGLGTLLVASLSFLFYVHAQFLGGTLSPWTPISQRLATGCLLVFIVAIFLEFRTLSN